MKVRLPHLGALAVVLATAGVLAAHGATAQSLPGVAMSSPPRAVSTPPRTVVASSRHPGSSTKVAATGPLLSSTAFASAAYEVFPRASGQLAQAEAGFQIGVQPASAGKEQLVVKSSSGATLLQRSFLSTDRAYWIETSYGDDGPGQDANLGDDGLVLTDAQGHITQK